jgi:hypothetical protein
MKMIRRIYSKTSILIVIMVCINLFVNINIVFAKIKVTTTKKPVISKKVAAPKKTVISKNVTTPKKIVISKEVTAPKKIVIPKKVTAPQQMEPSKQITKPDTIVTKEIIPSDQDLINVVMQRINGENDKNLSTLIAAYVLNSELDDNAKQNYPNIFKNYDIKVTVSSITVTEKTATSARIVTNELRNNSNQTKDFISSSQTTTYTLSKEKNDWKITGESVIPLSFNGLTSAKDYIYDGSVDDKNLFNGNGKLYTLNGQLYFDGEFSDGNRVAGKEYKLNKLFYEGSFSNNLYDGQGTFYNQDGTVAYSGLFKEGKPVSFNAANSLSFTPKDILLVKALDNDDNNQDFICMTSKEDNNIYVMDADSSKVAKYDLGLTSNPVNIAASFINGDYILNIALANKGYSDTRDIKDQTGQIVEMNITNGEKITTFDINIDPYDIHIYGNYIFVTSGSGQLSKIKTFSISDHTEISSADIKAQSKIIGLNGNGRRIITETTSTNSPIEMTEYNIDSNGIFTEQAGYKPSLLNGVPISNNALIISSMDIHRGYGFIDGSGKVLIGASEDSIIDDLSNEDMKPFITLPNTFSTSAYELMTSMFFTSAGDNKINLYDYQAYYKYNDQSATTIPLIKTINSSYNIISMNTRSVGSKFELDCITKDWFGYYHYEKIDYTDSIPPAN